MHYPGMLPNFVSVHKSGIRRFVKGLRSDLRISALQVAATAKFFQEVVDFVIEVEGVKPDDFTMTSTTKKFRKGREFNGSYSRGKGLGGHQSDQFSPHYRL